MAFTDQDLTKYFTTGFKNVPSTIEGMEEFANGILSYEGKFSPGNSSFYGWAKTALTAIKEYKEIASGKSKRYGSLDQEKASNRTGKPIGEYLLDQANKWLTGNAQPSKAKRVLEKYEDSKADINKKLQNELSNIANIMDFPEGMSEEEKAKLTAKADKIKAELQGTLEDAPLFGVSVNPDLVRTSGGFIPKDEATTVPAEPTTTPTTPQEYTTSGKDILLNGKIVGSAGTPEQAIQMAQNSANKAGGTFVEPIIPIPDLSNGYKSSILPSNWDLSNMTEEQIKNAEETYLAAGNSPTIMDKAIANPDVMNIDFTDEEMQAFYTEASQFIAGKGSDYAQKFQRAGEDFQIALKFETEQRKAQMEQEKFNAQLAKEQTQASAAEAGLATSGIRSKSEERLAEQAQNIATSSRRQFEYGVTGQGRKYEEYLGSSALSGLKLPELGGASVYIPTQGVRGSLEQAQETDIKTKAQQLEEAAIKRRAEVLAAQGNTTTQ